ncbi:MAG: phage major capsid protein [Eggerthellaceae bacterium]|nr:phage major capsid protein [Eggerthellaceae bacterium]
MADSINIIERGDVGSELMPDQVVTEIIQEVPKASVMLSHAKQVRMSSKKYKQPVLATLPEAYWVDGDMGLKSTSKSDWTGLEIVAEEMAVIVPIPDAVVEDSKINLWDAVKPLIAEAIGKKLDAACIFGADKPATWPDAIVAAATAAGNAVARTATTDLGQNVAELGAKVAKQGYGINGFVSKPGMQWELVGLRNQQGDPIYTPLPGSPANGLYGYELNEVMNGAWDASAAELVALDWSKQLIGIRQDVTYRIFEEGVISDSKGKILLNLMQQDTKALRVVFRVGYQVAKPKTRAQGELAYPGGVITPLAADSSGE